MAKREYCDKTFGCFLLRVGLAIVFLYAAITAFITPNNWIGFIPGFIESGRETFLMAFSVYEILLALWLLSNKKIFWASVVAAVTMLLIVVGNIFVLDIVFRDVAILFMAIALSVLTCEGGK
ncbi:MAG: hypothetical protein QGF74_02035 [Candidatus Nanoarchaeia archaeon]|jgi:hypothetical protein|nr:hypothetical protein [Candidatus Nanoarchaeia archaeon]|tara:strand:- start:48578 stop:48943 length:366 start_codon:yes stop_codon:yes gene_type:complete